MKFFLCVIGMVFILEGLPYFSFPHKMKSVLEQVREMPDSGLRSLGLVAIVIGLCLVFFGTR